jgi:manganese/zinc/iron transport system substrate-binding protein
MRKSMNRPLSQTSVLITLHSWKAIFCLLSLLTLSSPLSAGATPQEPLRVITTTGMVTDIVREIGGDRVDVKGIMGAGVDPHLYKATRSDIATMSRADVIFYSGLLLEGKITDALMRIATSGEKSSQ